MTWLTSSLLNVLKFCRCWILAVILLLAKKILTASLSQINHDHWMRKIIQMFSIGVRTPGSSIPKNKESMVESLQDSDSSPTTMAIQSQNHESKCSCQLQSRHGMSSIASDLTPVHGQRRLQKPLPTLHAFWRRTSMNFATVMGTGRLSASLLWSIQIGAMMQGIQGVLLVHPSAKDPSAFFLLI